MRLILASQSTGRSEMLRAAGVPFEAVSPGVDEEAAKASLRGEGLKARELADALAELKALKLSAKHPGALVLGCDSVVELQDGRMLDKAGAREEAAEHLRQLSGRRHYLYSAAVIAEAGRPIWRFVDRATMHVRPLSDAFIAAYLDREWEQARWCVGVYRVEGPGAQLFNRIEGSHFTVIGLPLLPLLDYLRTREVLTS
ncbi:septum formation protein Maf [Sphingomonas sp. ID1715]|uniref:Maf family protein n=1 Tax=Sphingomonas sp. ID1715 TaxID=1656898 RepID=UPI0014881471|nr:nucleoside triphosphate pyrophosphatase [Sphingomonas sp. ID1715]NNM77285.1 septum formation protein Maf [Sphingomonas sp. ID1715]